MTKTLRLLSMTAALLLAAGPILAQVESKKANGGDGATFMANMATISRDILPSPGYKTIVHLPEGEKDLVSFIKEKGGPLAASTEVARLWREGKIESVPDPEWTAKSDVACLAAQANLQQWQNSVLIAQTYAYGLSVVCFATGGPAVNGPTCAIALGAQGVVLWAQYEVNQAQYAVQRACTAAL